MTRAEIERELVTIDDQIDALYWAFTRQARAKPPCVVRPDLYVRRTALRIALRDARGPFGAVRPDPPGR